MLKKIKLDNFRNHKKFEIDLEKITVIVGPNGIGKTNILESLVILSFCKSFREEDKKNLINYDSEFARVTGDDLEVFFTRVPRLILKAKERGVSRKLSEFIGLLPSVIFSPETMSIITGAPAERRRFLDMMISQIDREYLEDLISYKKVRTQRNNLLQRIGRGESSEDELDFWDKELAKTGESIIKKRKKVIKSFNKELTQYYRDISGKKEDTLEVQFVENFEGDLLQNFQQNRRREIAYGGTLSGPHRDDLIFRLNKLDMSNFASRGEIKSAILALKISELEYLKENSKNERIKSGEQSPIILLDDIFSEFDPERRSHLSRLIMKYQTVITATEKEHLSPELLKAAKLIELS